MSTEKETTIQESEVLEVTIDDDFKPVYKRYESLFNNVDLDQNTKDEITDFLKEVVIWQENQYKKHSVQSKKNRNEISDLKSKIIEISSDISSINLATIDISKYVKIIKENNK